MTDERCRQAREAALAGEVEGSAPPPSAAEHLEGCEACRSWVATSEAVEALVAEAAAEVPLLDELTERRLVTAALDAAAAAPAERAPARRRWPVLAAAAAVVVAGLAGLALLALRGTGGGAPSPSPAPEGPGLVASASLCSGSCTAAGRPVAAGETLQPGEEIEVAEGGRMGIVLGGDHRVWLHGARGRVESVGGGEAVLRLVDGLVVARAAGPGLTIRTADGEASSLGTIYVVEARGGRLVRVETLEGTVAVRRGAAHQQVAAGQGLEPGEEPRPLATDRRDALLAMVGRDRQSGAGASLTVQTTPSGARVLLDGLDQGFAPVSLLLAPGAYALEVEAEGFSGVREELAVSEGEALRRLYHLEAAPAPDAGAAVAAAEVEPRPAAREHAPLPPQERTPSAYYERANALRREGRRAEAVAVYEELRSRFPGTAAARNATYSIGELSLQSLGRPQEALRAFEEYLAQPGGAVRQEAMLGRIEALRRLGRGEAERRAIEDYLARYPDGVGSESLRARLSP